MFKKVLEYAGEYRRTTYASIAVMLLGVLMSVLPYFFIYRLIAPPLTGELANPGQSLLWAAAIALCGVLYALPPGCLQHAAQSPGLPAGPPGKAAPGSHKGEGHRHAEKNVH